MSGFDFAGKRVLSTGASMGIGEALARDSGKNHGP